MTEHLLTIRLGAKLDLAWAQYVAKKAHYLRQPVDPRARPMVYIIEAMGKRLGLIMAGIPHATRNGGWWGYPDLPTQWQVVDLSRIYLSPRLQAGGKWCRPGIVPGFTDRHGVFRSTAATWAIREVLGRIQEDRVSLWPPVYPDEPYHILLVISYSDPKYHRGTIYREAGAEPMYTDSEGVPIPGPSGKYGWGWRLPEPEWGWWEKPILRPRTMRLPL